MGPDPTASLGLYGATVLSMTVRLDPEAWQQRAARHHIRADRLLSARSANPIEDFLWTYYATRPIHLTTWHPGAGTSLVRAEEYRTRRGYRVLDNIAEVDPQFITDRRGMIERIQHLLRSTSNRVAQYGCFGMHEWAMVFGQEQDEIRHARWPLRFDRQETEKIVEEIGIRCSHFDAFRFFTPSARPLNALQPSREQQSQMEQPGCIHANMDLFKWALKLAPMVDSELLLDTFENARELRMLDMQASPYDLRALGVDAVRIETAAGRSEYRDRQRALAEASMPLRARLLQWCEKLLSEYSG